MSKVILRRHRVHSGEGEMSDWIEAEQRAERAQQLLESECWPEALDELTAAIEINPHNAEWHGNRGYLLDQMGRHDDARGAYRLAVELDADNCEWLTALGLDLTRLGKLDEAIELFERIARLDPTNELAFCQRTAIYAYLNEHEKAEEMFYLAQQLKPDCPHCFYHLGTYRLNRRRCPMRAFGRRDGNRRTTHQASYGR